MPLAMSDLKAWQTHMDWTQLRSLHIGDPTDSELRLLLADNIPKLRQLRVDGGHLDHIRGSMMRYLVQIPSLESLAIEEGELRPLDDFLDVIEKYHPTLQSFKLNHQKDGPRPSGTQTTFWFPQLTELTLRFPPERPDQLYDGLHPQEKYEPELRIAMNGLRNYLKKGKVGPPFKVLRTFLGWKQFGDREMNERGPA